MFHSKNSLEISCTIISFVSNWNDCYLNCRKAWVNRLYVPFQQTVALPVFLLHAAIAPTLLTQDTWKG